MGIVAVLIHFFLSSLLVIPCSTFLFLVSQCVCPSVWFMVWKWLEDQLPCPLSSDRHYGSPFFGERSEEGLGIDHVKWAIEGARSTRRYRRDPAPEDGMDDAVGCVFCLCDLENGEEVMELRCSHLFHRACLDRWVGYGRVTCPLCRKTLTSKVKEAENPCGDAVDHRLSTADVMLAPVNSHSAWWEI